MKTRSGKVGDLSEAPALKVRKRSTSKQAAGEPLSEEAINWGLSLLRRRLCGSLEGDVSWLGPLDFAQDTCRKLTEILSDTIVHGFNNSALLLGQRGCGKSLVLEHVLRGLQSQFPGQVFPVRLNGLLHHDDSRAFKEIAKLLCMEHHLSFSKGASFSATKIFLADMLRDYSKENKAVIFILDEFDLFAQRSQQCLLYNLLDVMQSPQSQAAIVGISCRMDADLLLEKRVRSRFSQSKLVLSPSTLDDTLRLLKNALTLPIDSDIFHKDYAFAFNQNTDKLMEENEVKAVLKGFFEVDLSLRQLSDLAFRIISSMDRSQGLLSARDIFGAVSAIRCRPKMECLKDLSVLELYLLVSMKRLEGKERESYNFDLVFKEYEDVQRAHNTCDRYPRQVALRAFEHLLERELIAFSDSKVSPAKEFRPVKLIITGHELEEGLKANSCRPTALSRWNAREVFK